MTAPDESVSYEEALSPRDMGRLASAEEVEDRDAAQAITRAKRKKLTPLGAKLDEAARSRR